MYDEGDENVFYLEKPSGLPQYYDRNGLEQNVSISDPQFIGSALEIAFLYRTSYSGGILHSENGDTTLNLVPTRFSTEPPFTQMRLLPFTYQADEAIKLAGLIHSNRVSSNTRVEIANDVKIYIDKTINRVATSTILDIVSGIARIGESDRYFYFFPEFNMAPSEQFRHDIEKALSSKYSENVEKFFEIESGDAESIIRAGKKILAGELERNGTLYTTDDLLHDLFLCAQGSKLQQLHSALYYLGASGTVLKTQFGITEDIAAFSKSKQDLLVLHTDDELYFQLIRNFSQLLTKGKPKGIKHLRDDNRGKTVLDTDFYTNPVLSGFMYLLSEAILSGNISADLYEFKSGCINLPVKSDIIEYGLEEDLKYGLFGWAMFMYLASRGNNLFLEQDFYGLNSVTGYFGYIPVYNPSTGNYEIPQTKYYELVYNPKTERFDIVEANYSVNVYNYQKAPLNSDFLPKDRVKRQIEKQKKKIKNK